MPPLQRLCLVLHLQLRHLGLLFQRLWLLHLARPLQRLCLMLYLRLVQGPLLVLHPHIALSRPSALRLRQRSQQAARSHRRRQLQPAPWVHQLQGQAPWVHHLQGQPHWPAWALPALLRRWSALRPVALRLLGAHRRKAWRVARLWQA